MTTTIDVETRTIHRANFDHHYTADCFINADSYDSSRRGPAQQAWCIMNGGYIVAIVFAEYYSYGEQDALDEAADRDKLDFLLISQDELADYETGEKSDEGYPEYEGIAYLGNASEPFDQENLDMFQVQADLFALDPVIMAVVEEASRAEAVETLQDCQKDADYPVGYHVIGNAIDYLRTDVLPIACDTCHRTHDSVALHVGFFPADAAQTCCQLSGVEYDGG